MTKTNPLETSFTPPQACPACGDRLDVATGQGRPSPDDFTVCAYCGTLLRFGVALQLRIARPDETADADPELLRVFRDVARRRQH
jgi:hypothetical protein